MNLLQITAITATVFNVLLVWLVTIRDFRSTLHRVYLIWGSAVTAWNLAAFQMYSNITHDEAFFWAKILQLGVIFMPVSLFHLCALISQTPVHRVMLMLYAIYGCLGLSVFFNWFIVDVRLIQNVGYWSVPGPGFWAFFVLYCATTVALVRILYLKQRAAPPMYRTRLRALLLAIFGLWIFGTNDLLPILGIDHYPLTNLRFYPFGNLAALSYVIIVGYSVLQHQLLDVHVILGRIAAQGVRLLFVFLMGFTLLLVAFHFMPSLPTELVYLYFATSLLVLIATVVVASIMFPRLFGTGSDRLERRILGDRFEYHDKINGFVHSVPWYSDAGLLLDDLHELLIRTIQARSYQLVLLDEQTRAFTLLRAYPEHEPTTLPDFQLDSPVFRHFHAVHSDYLALGEQGAHPGGSKLEIEARRQLSRFDAEFCFPFFADEGPVGLMLLGRKTNGEPYTPHDLHLFSTLVRNLNLIINQLRLKQQVLQAEELELLGRMSRGMAHDLNNLVTPVWTFLQLVREGLAGNGATDELLPTAIRNVEAIRQYVKESLFYSTTFTPHFRKTRLDECVLKAANLVQPQLRPKNVTVLTEKLPVVEIEIDFVLIQRLLCNLLANACDASPVGGTIEVRILPLARTEAGRDWFRVLVEDHGEGISRENLKQIFRPYFTTKDRGSAQRGFGLGLAICRKIVHLHGGNLNIESQLNKGTTVIMDLPSRQQAAPAVKPKPEQLVPT